MRLAAALLLLFLTGCMAAQPEPILVVKNNVVIPPSALLEPCPQPRILMDVVRRWRDLEQYLIQLESAHMKCSEQVMSIIEWSEQVKEQQK